MLSRFLKVREILKRKSFRRKSLRREDFEELPKFEELYMRSRHREEQTKSQRSGEGLSNPLLYKLTVIQYVA